MFFPGPDPREPSSLSWPAWAPALSIALLIVTIGGLTTWLVLKLDALTPRVGDMIVFLPAAPEAGSWRLRVDEAAVKNRPDRAGPCVFDPNVMSLEGGSLIIEAREPADPPRFHLHWAGRHTAKGGNDCGAAADIVLDRHDLQRLANAAGGFGMKPRVIR